MPSTAPEVVWRMRRPVDGDEATCTLETQNDLCVLRVTLRSGHREPEVLASLTDGMMRAVEIANELGAHGWVDPETDDATGVDAW